MWRKWLAPNNASRQQMGFNSWFKGLNIPANLYSVYGSELLFHHESVLGRKFRSNTKSLSHAHPTFISTCSTKVLLARI